MLLSTVRLTPSVHLADKRHCAGGPAARLLGRLQRAPRDEWQDVRRAGVSGAGRCRPGVPELHGVTLQCNDSRILICVAANASARVVNHPDPNPGVNENPDPGCDPDPNPHLNHDRNPNPDPEPSASLCMALQTCLDHRRQAVTQRPARLSTPCRSADSVQGAPRHVVGAPTLLTGNKHGIGCGCVDAGAQTRRQRGDAAGDRRLCGRQPGLRRLPRRSRGQSRAIFPFTDVTLTIPMLTRDRRRG